MRRIACVCAAIALVVGSALPASASSGAVEASARASILAGIVDVQPAFDPAIVDSLSRSSTIGTSTTASVIWPSFLVDAFFYLYGFQSVERIGLGIAESRWPSGPTTADATLSDLAFANGGDASTVPGKAGRSRAVAAPGATRGRTTVTDATLPAGITLDGATSVSDVDGSIHAEQTVVGLNAGPVRIGSIVGSSSIDGQDASARLVVVDATVAGVSVTIDDQGAHAATAAAQAVVDAALKDRGFEVRIIPVSATDGRDARASSGGVSILASQQATDPTGTPRDVRVGVTLGVATAARGVTVIPPVDDVGSGARPTPIGFMPVHIEPPARGTPGYATPPAAIVRTRQIVTPIRSAPVGGARAAYGALLLIAAGALLFRPLVRAVARP